MKTVVRTLAAAAALAVVPVAGYAQIPEIGFRIGPSFANLSGFEDAAAGELEPGETFSTSRRTGLALGGYAILPFGGLSLQAEAMYVQKGGAVGIPATIPTATWPFATARSTCSSATRSRCADARGSRARAASQSARPGPGVSRPPRPQEPPGVRSSCTSW